MKEPPVILAGPPADLAQQRQIGIVQYRPKEGSQQRACAECSGMTWLGPMQLLKLEQTPAAAVICFVCAARAGMNVNGSLSDKGGEYLVRFLRAPRSVS